MKLYTYWRSSAAYRVRIALNLKNIKCEYIYISLIKDGGEHLSDQYNALNPQNLVPSLIDDNQNTINQSLAIIEYLDEIHPQIPLLPKTPIDRANARSLVQIIACEIHPLNNLRVLKYLTNELSINEDQKNQWYRHWINVSFPALEEKLSKIQHQGKFALGEKPGIVDCYLIPQIYNAKRFNMPLDDYPTLARINDACLKLPAFDKAVPENQADAA